MSDKNRDLPITDYLDILQKEYIVAEIRHKIYQKISDKTYWKRVMDGKKKKIEDICFRNKILNIFNSDKEKKRLYGLIYNESGPPNFIYKNDVQRYGNGDYPGLEESDLHFYYSDESNVRVGLGKDYKLGVINGYTPDRSEILVEVDGQEKPYPKEIVTRIL